MADDMGGRPHHRRHKRLRKSDNNSTCCKTNHYLNKVKMQENESQTIKQHKLKILFYDTLFLTRGESLCSLDEHTSIIVTKKSKKKKRKNQITRRPMITTAGPGPITTNEYLKIMAKKCSEPEMHQNKIIQQKTKRWHSDTYVNTSTPFRTKLIIKNFSLDLKIMASEYQPFLKNPLMQAQLRIYRCQLSTNEESCCFTCNSDAMFEVMKSLYDCNKKKDCNHCESVLCGHLPREERRLDEARKPKVGVGVAEKTESMKIRTNEAMKQSKEPGLLEHLTGKPPEEKGRVLKGLANQGIPLAEGRTPSEKILIKEIQADEKPISSLAGIPFEKRCKAKAVGFLTSLSKSPEQKEKIIRALAQSGIPFPEGKTRPEKKLIGEVRKEVGLPLQPKTPAEKQRYIKAQATGLKMPLEGKSTNQKEKLLMALVEQGISFQQGRNPSEEVLIEKIKAEVKPISSLAGISSEKIGKAKAASFLTPLTSKSPEQKEKILRGLIKSSIPFPEGKTPSEKKLIDKVKTELGLPPETNTHAEKRKYAEAQGAGLTTPLEGETREQKENILKSLAEKMIPLPDGRTPSKKALINKHQSEAPGMPSIAGLPSKKLRKAKAVGFLTTLDGKTPEQKEKIIRGLAQSVLPLFDGKTQSEKKLVDKVRKELGLPPTPPTQADKDKYGRALAAGLITPLEGKTKYQKEKILKALAEKGITLPEGRTPSEKSLIKKLQSKAPGVPSLTGIPSENLQKAKAATFLTPLTSKSPEQKEKILHELAKNGIPLLEGKSPSEKKLIGKVRTELGLPPEPKTQRERRTYAKAQATGLIVPLEEKSKEQKKKILKALMEKGIALPEEGTPSDKALIYKFHPEDTGVPSEKVRKAKAAGFLMTLDGKIPEQNRKRLGLPPTPPMQADNTRALAAGLITPLAGKTKDQKENLLTELTKRGILLPKGRTPSEKAPIEKIKSEKIRKAKTVDFLIPLTAKSPEQRQYILCGLAKSCIPLPERKTLSDKKLHKIRAELGLPPEPKTHAERRKYAEAQAAGLITPLEGKSKDQKEKILKSLAEKGIPLPEGRTASEKYLIKKLQSETPRMSYLTEVPSEKIRKAKKTIFMKPLAAKIPEQKEKILCGLAQNGIPLSESKTASEKKLIDKIRRDLGLPQESTTPAERQKYTKAQAAGLITPLEGKTNDQKENILMAIAQKGIPLPESTTPSDKTLMEKIKAEVKSISSLAGIPLEKICKDAGFLTVGKSPEQKEKSLQSLAQNGIPLPQGKTESEKKLKVKIQKELGLLERKTHAEKQIYADAQAAELITPLEGKLKDQKEKILKAQKCIPPLERRTATEKSLVKKIRAELKLSAGITSEKLRKVKEAGLLTPLEGKTPGQKEKILRGIGQLGMLLPEGKTASDKKLIDRIPAELGIPPEPTTKSVKEKYEDAKAQGLIQSLEEKSPAENERILKGLAAADIPIPEGRKPSGKALVKKIKTQYKLVRAKAAGLLTPLDGKTSEQKQKILKGLVKAGLPLPEGKTLSGKQLINKILTEMAVPLEQKTPSMKEKYRKALSAGIIIPLEGKTPVEKERILQRMKNVGIELPEGRTTSEKSLVGRIKGATRPTPSAKLQDEKAAGLLTPLEGKTPKQKEKNLKRLAKSGLPLSEGKTPSANKLIKKIKTEMGLSSEPKTPSMKKNMTKSLAAGIITPLEGKSPVHKKNILKSFLTVGIPLPDGKTHIEKELVKKKSGKETLGVTPSAKMHAKAAGLLTPLEGKTPKQKTKIIRRLLDAGLPLPKGKTISEKSLTKKLQKKNDNIKKAKKAGFLTPVAGKTKEEKQTILKGLAEGDLPMPEGDPPSEKELVRQARIRRAGLASEVTPVEKKRYVATETGPYGLRKVAKGMVTKSIGGIQEEVEEIVKTTRCERDCGCYEKKNRLKHSYVKIRVTSPDISSFCSCPNECIPGVDAGVFTDSKVTVGRVTVIPSYTARSVSVRRSFLENQMSLQSVPLSHDLIYSHMSLRISSVDDSINESTDSGLTVYIYNSDTDVSISDIKRLLRRSIHDNHAKTAERPLSYIYKSHLVTNRNDNNQSARWYITTSRSQNLGNASDCCSESIYIIETDSSTSMTSDRSAPSVLPSFARNIGLSTELSQIMSCYEILEGNRTVPITNSSSCKRSRFNAPILRKYTLKDDALDRQPRPLKKGSYRMKQKALRRDKRTPAREEAGLPSGLHKSRSLFTVCSSSSYESSTVSYSPSTCQLLTKTISKLQKSKRCHGPQKRWVLRSLRRLRRIITAAPVRGVPPPPQRKN